ncbi:MAG: hypothetical protein ACLRVN_04890 [Butyricicoccus sp.]
MNKQHILGFFDDLARTPVFLFLCAMFLCGAAAGGLTGLRAGEGTARQCFPVCWLNCPRMWCRARCARSSAVAARVRLCARRAAECGAAARASCLP